MRRFAHVLDGVVTTVASFADPKIEPKADDGEFVEIGDLQVEVGKPLPSSDGRKRRRRA